MSGKPDPELARESALRVRILGPLVVEGVDSSKLGSHKQRTLLRVLAAGGGAPVSVDRLAECLWPVTQPARPTDQVGVLVSRLRAVLGSHRIARTDAGYALVADWIDLVALDQLAAESSRQLAGNKPAAAATAANAGLALAAGPLLVDELDAPWADEARITAERTLARLRLIAAEASLATGDPFGAASAAQSALDDDPYDEHALRLLMTAHARAGRPSSALAVYAKTRETLLEALGASPSELTEALHLRILRDDIRPDGGPAPPPDGRHVDLPGRDNEWRSMDEALSRSRNRIEIVVVLGEAGIGKTRFLEDWSRSIASTRTVMWSRCDPIGALPFQPVLDALDEHLSQVDETEAVRLRTEAGPVLGPLLRGFSGTSIAHDPLTAQARLFAGALNVCCQVDPEGPAVLVIDDGHMADPTTASWLRYIARRRTSGRLLVAVMGRPEMPFEIAEASSVTLGPLDLEAVAQVVGTERAPVLFERSGGNPLFLVELAGFPDHALPASILESVSARCTQAGTAQRTLRTAAVLGSEIDLDLLAGVLQESAVSLLSDLEKGHRLMLLEERGTTFVFRHDLVREALVEGTGASRRALAHREAARILSDRPGHDSVAAAMHARMGGNLELAASELIVAASVASTRFDHAEAERLLDDSINLRPSSNGYLARGRVCMTVENFTGASADAEEALNLGAGVEALELASWAAYYRRDFDAARSLSHRAESALNEQGDSRLRRSVLALAGRIAHADGDLDAAGDNLEAAVTRGSDDTPDGGVAPVWLGWLLADRGEAERSQQLAERSQLDGSLSVHPFAAAHQALLSSYNFALLGRVVQALSWLDTVDREVELRHLDHFVGRTANYRAWLLRNLLFEAEADELNLASAEIAGARGLREPQVQSALDIADGRLRSGDLQGAAERLLFADSLGTGFAFSWKARLRCQLLNARLALADDRAEEALSVAEMVVTEATRLGAPRYRTLAQVVEVRANFARSSGVATRSLARLLDDVAKFAAPEAWWITAELASDLRIDRLWDVAEKHVVTIAGGAGARADDFRRQAGTRMERMRS